MQIHNFISDPVSVDRSMTNAHLQKVTKLSSGTRLCMSGSLSDFLNLSPFYPECPKFLVHVSENVPIFFKTVMRTVTMTDYVDGLGNPSVVVVHVT
jgi:hypothetical protein